MVRTFVESSAFSHRVNKEHSGLLREIQEEILENPSCGRIIQGTGGLRKVRFGDESRGKGKRGGFRVIFLDLPHVERTYLLAIYDKNEKDDISTDEKKILRDLVARLKKEAEK
jgi:hypothetical protein